MTSPDIVCMGEAMVEFTEREPGVFEQGFGGDTSNCAIAASRQGARAGYVTAVGVDAFGDRLLALWSDEGIDTRGVLRSESHPTAHYFVTHGDQGHEFHYYRAGSAASRLSAQELPRDYLTGIRVLHVSAISQAISATAREAVTEAMRVARSAGALISYDTNLRLKLWPLDEARTVILDAVALADIVLPGLDDAMQLTGLESPEDIVAFYQGLGPSVVALSMGADGVYVAADQRREHVPGFEVDCVDASGAGDTFDGAFLAMIVAGADPFAAARHANAAAALSTTGYGAVTPIPTKRAVEVFVEVGSA